MGQKLKGHGQRHELVGRRFGRLLVIELVHEKSFRNWQWICKCDCGVKKLVTATRLVSGHTKSCGCLRRDLLGKRQRTLRPYESSYKLLINDNANRKTKFKLELSYEDYVKFTQTKNCHYCNDEILWYEYRNDHINQNFGYNLDRLDSSKGYSKENCVVCCGICNWMKWKLGYEQFIKQVHKIAKNQERNGINS
jgi:hypothetical protein